MTMKERIDKEKTKLSEKKLQETELKNDKLSNNKIKGENEWWLTIKAKNLQKQNFTDEKF